MPRRFSAAEVEGALNRIGFRRARQRGSHITLREFWRGATRSVQIVAREKIIPARRMASVLRQAALSAEEMMKLVNGEDVGQ